MLGLGGEPFAFAARPRAKDGKARAQRRAARRRPRGRAARREARVLRAQLGPTRQVARPGGLMRLLLAAVRLYQRWLSPLKRRPTCRYLPTCSEYAAQALTTHGAAKGSALTLARILRCNPFFHPGYHPVPKAGAWVVGEHEGH